MSHINGKPDVPHFDYPFRFLSDGHAATVEQDTDDDHLAQAMAILKTPLGFRMELPEFGVAEHVFDELPLGHATEDYRVALEMWMDSDALEDIIEEYSTLDRFVTHIVVQLKDHEVDA